MLVATPGQTTAYSTLHNSGNTTTTGASAKKSTLTSTTATSASGTPKTIINNNHNTTTISTSNTNNSYNHHPQPPNNKNGNNNINTTTSTSSKDPKSSTAHSLKTENSTKPTNFIQTLKDSVQKALISTTGHSSIFKNNSDKLQNCNNSTTTTTSTSLQNVTSSSSSNNAKAAAPATAASSISNNSATAASTSSSSLSLVRSKQSVCSLSKLHTIAPTILHRFPEDRQHASSTDSLQKEMCHFKPIRTVPTTPWKSGSKSRGNSLRFPQPNIATQKTEFILKSNCDVNNRKKNQQQQQQQIKDNLDDEDDDYEDEQENKEYHGIYKLKPSSTYLSTTVTTSNHQSAFVCLVDGMKNLVNIPSKKIINSGKNIGVTTASADAGSLEIAKTKSARTARPTKDVTTILNVTTTSKISNTPNIKTKSAVNIPVNELFVNQKQKTTNKSLIQAKKVDIPRDLAKTSSTRITRLTLAASEKKKTQQVRTNIAITPFIEDNANVKTKSPKSGNISKISPAGITKAKSRRKLGSAKLKTINIIQSASTVAKQKLLPSANARGNPAAVEPHSQMQINKRKRKINHLKDNEPIPDASATPPLTYSNAQGKARKNVRLSKNIGANNNKLLKNQLTANTSNSKHLQKQRSAICLSPPLTRARLKHLNQEQQGKIVANSTSIVEIKKRKV